MKRTPATPNDSAAQAAETADQHHDDGGAGIFLEYLKPTTMTLEEWFEAEERFTDDFMVERDQPIDPYDGEPPQPDRGGRFPLSEYFKPSTRTVEEWAASESTVSDDFMERDQPVEIYAGEPPQPDRGGARFPLSEYFKPSTRTVEEWAASESTVSDDFMVERDQPRYPYEKDFKCTDTC